MSEANNMTAELMLRVPERFPGAVVWRSNRIEAKGIGRGGKVRHLSAGIDGQGDLTGIFLVNGYGVRIEIEVKAGKDRMRPSQIAFQNMIQTHCGIYVLCRDVDTCLELIAAAITKLRVGAAMKGTIQETVQ